MAIALGVKAVLKGYQVRFYTLTDLIAELYAALADNSLDRKINNILKNDCFLQDEIPPFGSADIFLDSYAAKPMLCRYSIGLIPPKDTLILSSLYQIRYLLSMSINSSKLTPRQDLW